MINRIVAFFCILLIVPIAGCIHRGIEKADILILNMGSPATPKIARRLEMLNVSYTILDGLAPLSDIKQVNPKAIIITGSPESVLDEGTPRAPMEYFKLNVPILGLCYGMQMIAEQLGGKVRKCTKAEKDVVAARFTGGCGITPPGMQVMNVLMDHEDCVVEAPEGFHTDTSTEITQHAMICHHKKKIHLIQFHPERYDTVPESGVILDAWVRMALKKP